MILKMMRANSQAEKSLFMMITHRKMSRYRLLANVDNFSNSKCIKSNYLKYPANVDLVGTAIARVEL